MIHVSIRSGLNFFSRGPKSLPCEINKVPGANEFEDGKGKGRCLKDDGNSQRNCACVDKKTCAQAQHNEQAGGSSPQSGLCQDEDIVRSWSKAKENGCGKESY